MEQPALKQIFKHEGSEISNVRVIINSGTTGIKPNLSLLYGMKNFFFSMNGIKKLKRHLSSLIHQF
jgi:hypothetical protein